MDFDFSYPLAPGDNQIQIFPDKVALLVAGVNYPRVSQGNADPQGGRTYFNYCLNYKKHLFDGGLVDRVIIFDFLNGDIRGYDKGGSEDGQVLFRHGALTPKNYRYTEPEKVPFTTATVLKTKRIENCRRMYFPSIDDLARGLEGDPDADVVCDDYVIWRGLAKRTLSVADVYETFPSLFTGTCAELHFFGHAVHSGPVIVNTMYHENKTKDLDARATDPFNPTLSHVFGKGSLEKSRAAFTAAPIVCIWGCDAHSNAINLLRAASAKKKKNESAATELAGVRKELTSSYAAVLARQMNFEVVGPLPGTGAIHETGKGSLMRIDLDMYAEILGLYEEHKKDLGISFKTAGIFKRHSTYGRGYAIYKP